MYILKRLLYVVCSDLYSLPEDPLDKLTCHVCGGEVQQVEPQGHRSVAIPQNLGE